MLLRKSLQMIDFDERFSDSLVTWSTYSRLEAADVKCWLIIWLISRGMWP